MEDFPEKLATDPTKVIEKTIQGIIKNKLHVFPDRIANHLRVLKQYFPFLAELIIKRFNPKK
ncbi:MAG: hypothetical protein ACOC0N_08070 [Chroococcales cyanobacterium]